MAIAPGIHRPAPPTTFIHPDSHHLLDDYVRAVQAGALFAAVAVHRRRDGTPFQVEVRGTAFTYRQRPCLLSVIRDNGRGFDLDHTPAGHCDLSMMRERANTIGAELTVASRPGKGSKIVIRWAEQWEEAAAAAGGGREV
jgi:hypothetical protein